MEDALQKDQLRNLLAPMVNKVPSSINGASVDVTRKWKALVVKARKAMDSRKATAATLQSLYMELSQYK